MKKIYLLAVSIALCSVGIAQNDNSPLTKVKNNPNFYPVHHQVNNSAPKPVQVDNSRFTPIWEDDFSDPTTWEVDNNSSPAVDWEITTDVNAPVVPNGCPTCIPINTPTAGNGYAWIDGDGQGDGSTQNSNIRNATPVDLSDYDAVALRFYCVTRNWQSTYTVRVSGDGGETWTDYPVLTWLEINTNTANPELVQLNISEAAAGQSEVVIEFNFVADWGWWWAIDDVALGIPDDNDLNISNASYSSAYVPDESLTARDVEYSMYQVDQVRSITFGATATNVGAMAQTDVYLSVHITGPDTDVTLTSEMQNIPIVSSADFAIEGFTIPATPGVYTVDYTIMQNEEDATPDDNIATQTFSVDENVYARDRDGYEFLFNTGLADFRAGPAYYIEETIDIHCIGAALAGTSEVGTYFDYELHGADVFNLTTDLLAITNGVEVEEFMLNAGGEENFTWLGFPGNASQTLNAGQDYAVMFHNYLGQTIANVAVSPNAAPDFTSFIYAEFETQNCEPCFTDGTFMVRMGLSQDFCSAVVWTNVDEIEMVSVNELYPNPTAGLTTLEYTLIENSDVQIFVFDNMGRVMLNKDMGTQTVGEYRFDYDFSNLAAGAYTLSIKANDNYVNKKLVIK